MFSLQSTLQTHLGSDVLAAENSATIPTANIPTPIVIQQLAINPHSSSQVAQADPPAALQSQVNVPYRFAIAGDGFFILDASRSERLYTRENDFRLNRRQQLVTRDGLPLLGYGVDEYGQIDASRLVPLMVPIGRQLAASTKNAFFSGDLSPAGADATLEFVVYDKTGNPLNIILYAHQSNISAEYSAYGWSATHIDSQASAASSGDLLGAGEIWFDRNGNVIAGSQGSILVDRSHDGAAAFEVTLHFDRVRGLAKVDANGNSVSVLRVEKQDGAPLGTLTQYSITEQGTIRGLYSNGIDRILGQIQLANFIDPYGLAHRQSGRYAATRSAGTRTLENPGQGLFGEFVPIPAEVDIDLSCGAWSARYPWELRTRHFEIQGDGYFVVMDSGGQRYFTREGRFHLNAQQQLVTDNGLRLLGYGVDDQFMLDPSRLVPIQIPLGQVAASATKAVVFNGVLNPRVDVGDTPGIIESQLFWDAAGLSDSDFPLDEARVSTLPLATAATRLVDVVRLYTDRYDRPFREGTLRFHGLRGNRSLAANLLAIGNSTTLGDLISFMEHAFAVDVTAPHKSSGAPGGTIDNGRVRFVSNLGIENELAVSISAFAMRPAGDDRLFSVGLAFQPVQSANGEGVTTHFTVFDAIGNATQLTLTTVLESKVGENVSYRWFVFAASDESSPPTASAALGNGRLTFTVDGKLIAGQAAHLVIDRDIATGQSPFAVELDFRQLLSEPRIDMSGQLYQQVNVVSQDGYPPGALQEFIVTDSGQISGVFDDGMARTLGQIQLATFRNPRGLANVDRGLFVATGRSGQPRLGTPGMDGFGDLSINSVVTHTPPTNHPWRQSLYTFLPWLPIAPPNSPSTPGPHVSHQFSFNRYFSTLPQIRSILQEIAKRQDDSLLAQRRSSADGDFTTERDTSSVANAGDSSAASNPVIGVLSQLIWTTSKIGPNRP